MKKLLYLAVAVVLATSLTACTTPSEKTCGCNHADKKITCPKDCKCGCHEGKECSCKKCKCGCHEGKECNCAKHDEKTGTCNKK